MSRATFSIMSRSTGDAGADETFTFAEQSATNDSSIQPLLLDIRHSPETIKSGEILFNPTWTVTLGDMLMDTGATYWGDLLRRIPYWRGRDAEIRWVDGDQNIRLVIDSVTRMRGSVQFRLTSPIRDALSVKPVQFERVVKLAQDLGTSGDMVLTEPMGRLPYIKIDDEVLVVSGGATHRNSTTIPTLSLGRGVGTTTAAAHTAGTTVTRVLRVQGTLSDAIRLFLRNELDLGNYIDERSFAEAKAWFRPIRVDGWFTDEATTADDILGQMLRLGSASLVYDEFERRIRLVSQVVWQRRDFKTISDDTLLASAVDGWKASEQSQSQTTRCLVQVGDGNIIDPKFTPVGYVDADAESDDEYGKSYSKEIKTRLLNQLSRTTAEASANTAAQRIVEQFRDPSLRIEGLKLHGADGRAIKTGEVAVISLPEFGQSADGTPEAQACLVESAERNILDNTSTLRLARFRNYQPDFIPRLITISTERAAIDLAEEFGVEPSDPAFEGTLRVVDGGVVYGTSPTVPAIRTGTLPAGTKIRVEALYGGIITGASGLGGRQGSLPENGGDVFDVTSGEVSATCDNQSVIAPGGSGGSKGGDGGIGTQVSSAAVGGDGGNGAGWDSQAGEYLSRGANGRDGADGFVSAQNNVSPQNGDGGLGGGIRTERYLDFSEDVGVWRTRLTEFAAEDGDDSTSSLDGAGAGGGGRGGNHAERGKQGGDGGDSGSNSGTAANAVTAEPGKLARVSAGASFQYDTDHDCILGDVVGASNPRLKPPVVTVNEAGNGVSWSTPTVGGLTITTVIERQEATGDIEEVSSTAASGTLTNTSSEARSYRARATATGYVPSEWVFFSLLPQVSGQLAAPVVTLNSENNTASFTVPTTAANSIIYEMQARNTLGEWYDFKTFRQGDHTHSNTTGLEKSYRIRAVDTSGVQQSSSYVEFVLQSVFYGRLQVSQNEIMVGEGNTASFTVSLTAQPLGNVNILVTQSDASALTVLTTSLSFTTSNWSTPQTVSVRANQDANTINEKVGVLIDATGGGYTGQSETVTVSITDDDVPGLTLSGSTLAIEEGEDEDITVRLRTQPTSNVTVTLTSGDSNLTLDDTSLTFTPTNWNSNQTVTVTAGHDPDHLPLSTTISLSAAGATEYVGVTASIAVTVTDDDTPAFVLSTNGITVLEGSSNTFNINLATQPQTNVTVTLAASTGFTLGSSGSNTQQSLTFTSTTWNSAQTVTVRHTEDADRNNTSGTVSITASGGGYGSVTGSVSLTGVDDDVLAVPVANPTSLTITEGAGGSFTVRLQQQPPKARTVTVTSSDTGAVTVSPSSLDFSTSNWNSPQNVSVNAPQDADTNNETATITLGGTNIDSKTVTVNVTDDDSLVDVLLSATGLAIIEQGSGSFGVRLSGNPGQTVTLQVNSTNSDVTASPSSLTFSPSNFLTLQTVTVSAADDTDQTDDTATISVNGTGVNGRSLTVRVTDDDKTPAIIFDPTRLDITEGNSGTTAIRLGSRPSANVTLSLTGGSGQGWTASSSSLTFAPSDWNTPQNVTVTANSDGAGNTVPLRATASSTDSGYNGISNNLAIGITAPPGITFSATSGTVTEESSIDVTARLDSPPSSNVTLTFSSSNSDVTVDANAGGSGTPTTMTFTPSNWNSTQTFRINAAADSDRSNETATITATASGASEYSGLTRTFTATVLDNDDREILVSPTPPLSVNEGGSVTFTVAPATQPAGNLRVFVDSLDGSALTPAEDVVRFSRTDWAPKSVTKTAVQDPDADSEAVTVRISGSGVVNRDITVNITDDDNPAVVFGASTLSVNEGATASFTVRLSSAPSSSTTVSLSSSDTGAATVSPSTMTFTSSSWNTTQTATVTGVQDADTGNETVTITGSATGHDSDTISVTVTDDDNRGLEVSIPSSVSEGSSVTATARLLTQPTGNVTVNLRASGTGSSAITVTPASRIFTPSNWNTTQSWTVAAGDDVDFVNNSITMTFDPSGADYATVPSEVRTLSAIDTGGGFSVSSRRISLGSSPKTVNLRLPRDVSYHFLPLLDQAPSGTALISHSSNSSGVQVGRASTSLGPDGSTFPWNEGRQLVINVLRSATVGSTAVVTFSSFQLGTVTVNIEVLDTPPQMLASYELPVGGTTHNIELIPYAEHDISFNLDSRPSGAVTYTLTRTGDAGSSRNQIFFGSNAWQNVRSGGIWIGNLGNSTKESPSGTITMTSFNRTATVLNITPGTGIAPSGIGLSISGTTTIAEGSSTTLQVSLQSAPSSNETVNIALSGDSDITTTTSSLTFTPANWNTAQSVTFSAAEDADTSDDTATATFSGTGVETATITLTVTDNDEPLPTPSYTYNLPITGGHQSAFPRLDVSRSTGGTVIAIVLTSSPGSTRTYTTFTAGASGLTITPIGNALTYTTSDFGTASMHLYRLETTLAAGATFSGAGGIQLNNSHYLAIDYRSVD